MVHVPDFESGPLSGKPSRAQGGQTAFVGQFSQRISLVHELRQLGASEEFLDGCHNRLGIDELGGAGVDFLHPALLVPGVVSAFFLFALVFVFGFFFHPFNEVFNGLKLFVVQICNIKVVFFQVLDRVFVFEALFQALFLEAADEVLQVDDPGIILQQADAKVFGHILVQFVGAGNLRHFVLDGTLQAGDPDTELVPEELSGRADPAVPQMVDIIHWVLFIILNNLKEVAHGGHDIIYIKKAVIAAVLLIFRSQEKRYLMLQFDIQLVAAYIFQIIAFGIEEEVPDHGF